LFLRLSFLKKTVHFDQRNTLRRTRRLAMKNSRRFAIGLVLLAVGSTVVNAEGRPRRIAFGPVTITDSGAYVVTSDISVITPPAITIAAPNVIIDLDGHTVGAAGFNNGDVIVLGAGADRFTIKDGRITGGTQCLASSTTGVKLSMDRVTCTGGKWGIAIPSASSVSITDSELSPAGYAAIIGGAFSLRFERNTVKQALPYPQGISCGVSFSGVTNGTITDSLFQCTAYNGTALSVNASGQVRVERNLVSGYDTLGGMFLEGRFIVTDNSIENCRYPINASGDGSSIMRNTITNDAPRGQGIDLFGSDNRVIDNDISDCLYGINVAGSRNKVSGNLVQRFETGVTIYGADGLISGNRINGGLLPSSVGLLFRETSSGNTYEDNDLRGTTGVEDLGVGNVDAGGNIE
jgi:parallel beta-helix repeat protein